MTYPPPQQSDPSAVPPVAPYPGPVAPGSNRPGPVTAAVALLFAVAGLMLLASGVEAVTSVLHWSDSDRVFGGVFLFKDALFSLLTFVATAAGAVLAGKRHQIGRAVSFAVSGYFVFSGLSYLATVATLGVTGASSGLDLDSVLWGALMLVVTCLAGLAFGLLASTAANGWFAGSGTLGPAAPDAAWSGTSGGPVAPDAASGPPGYDPGNA